MKKVIIVFVLKILIIMPQTTATATTAMSLHALSKLCDHTKDAIRINRNYGRNQLLQKKVKRDITSSKEHLNNLLNLYGARRSSLELSTESHLINEDAYSEYDDNMEESRLSDSFNTVAEKAARNAIYNIVDESDMDDKERPGQKMDKSFFDNLMFVDVPDDQHSNNEETKPKYGNTKDDAIVNEENIDARARKTAEKSNNATHASAVTKPKTAKTSQSLKETEQQKPPVEQSKPLKQSDPIKVAQQSAVKSNAPEKLTKEEESKVRNALAMKRPKGKHDLVQSMSELKGLTGNDESKGVNHLGTKDFIEQAQKDVDLAKKAYEVFKKVSEEIYSNKRNIRIGGLYDEYKKRLDTILQQKRSGNSSKMTSQKDLDLQGIRSELLKNETPLSEKSEFPNKEESAAVKLREQIRNQKQPRRKKKQHRQSKTHPEGKNSEFKESELDQTASLSANKNQEEAKVATQKEHPANTSYTNPYFLPNSKYRQTPFSEVPLKPKAGLADEPKNPDNGKSSPPSGTTVGNAKQVSVGDPNAQLMQSQPKKPAIAKLEPYLGVNTSYIKTALKALGDVPYSSLYDEYQKQMSILNHMLRAKQRWWNEARKSSSLRAQATMQAAFADLPVPVYSCQLVDDVMKSSDILSSTLKRTSNQMRRDADAQNRSDPHVLAKTLEYTLNPGAAGQCGGNLLANAASKMNMTPTELAQRLTNTTFNPFEESFAQVMKTFVNSPAQNVSNPINVPPAGSKAVTSIADVNAIRPVVLTDAAVVTPQPHNINNVLEKILQKLECLQQVHVPASVVSSPADNFEFGSFNPTGNCAENPTDGSPCNLIGSWQSCFLGVRLDINSVCDGAAKRERRWWFRRKPKKKEYTKYSNTMKPNESMLSLQVHVRETTPPSKHDFMENLYEWHFDAWTAKHLGGPLVMTVRKCGKEFVGTFIGYCRTCGSIDTIFGSWTFCTPSKDCQDIMTAFFEKRDMLRRYKMNENRRERYKNMLFKKCSFAKKDGKRS